MTAEHSSGPLTSYEEYLRRYPRRELHVELPLEPSEEDIAQAAERHGRNVLREAAASLLVQTPEPLTAGSTKRSHQR